MNKFFKTLSILATIALFAACGVSTPSPATEIAPTNTPPPNPATEVPASPLVGTWQRVNSCASFVQAFKEAGLIDLAPEWLIGGGYFTSLDQIDSTDLCKGATEVLHSHFFTANGEFGSRDEMGRQVDDGSYQMVDDRTITFPSNGVTVHFSIEDDALMFEVVVPDPCVGSCRVETAWALSAFYPGPFQRVPSSTAMRSEPSWTYVAFGDSWPYGGHCNGCRPFPALYADGLMATTDHRIDFINLTTNGGTSQSLLKSIQTSQKTREAIMSADIIVIATGGNDFAPAFDLTMAGNCGGADQLDCFRDVAEGYRLSFDKILTEIEGLRNGQPTAIRLVANSNEFLADPLLIEPLGADFGKTSGVAITQMNRDVLCEIATKHNTQCIDLGLALNGPDLLRPQDVNTQEAMQAVADALLASGLDELY